MKNDDSIIETIPWITPFIDVKTMNIHPKNGNFFFFWKNDENILWGGDFID